MFRLKDNLCKSFGVKEIIWDCGWGARHFKGCLESFQALVAHHPDIIKVLKGNSCFHFAFSNLCLFSVQPTQHSLFLNSFSDRTVIFGRETGVSMDGHIVLNSGEVRRNWLDSIKNVEKHDAVILRIPSVQRALSKSLKDIKVVHR